MADEAPKPHVNGEPKFTKALGEKFVEIVRRGNFRETACAQVGVASRTLRKWLSLAAAGDKRYVAFVQALDAAEAAAEDIMVVAIRRAAMEDWRAAAWYLERRGAKRWGFKAQVEFTVEEELSRILNVVEQQLGSDAAARVFGALTDGQAGPRAPAGPGETEGGEGSGEQLKH